MCQRQGDRNGVEAGGDLQAVALGQQLHIGKPSVAARAADGQHLRDSRPAADLLRRTQASTSGEKAGIGRVDALQAEAIGINDSHSHNGAVQVFPAGRKKNLVVGCVAVTGGCCHSRVGIGERRDCLGGGKGLGKLLA